MALRLVESCKTTTTTSEVTTMAETKRMTAEEVVGDLRQARRLALRRGSIQMRRAADAVASGSAAVG